MSAVNCSLSFYEASKVVKQHSTADTGASNLFIKGVGIKEISKDESSMVATYDAKEFNVPLLPE
jgi:flagellar basal body rod protein FlgC